MKPLWMNRPDFDLKVVELPRLGEREVEGFLKYRTAGLYPAHPGETAFDYRIWRQDKTQFAFLFITRRAVLESYREKAAGRPLLLPFLLVLPYLKEHAGQGAGFLVLCPDCLEVFVFRPGRPPAAFLHRRAKRLDTDLGAALRLAGAGEPVPSWVVLCGPQEEAELGARAAALAPEGAAPRLVRVADALRRLGRDRGLFAPPRRAPLLSAGLRRQLLVFCLLLLGLLALRKLAGREQAYHQALLRQAGLLQSRSEVAALLQEQVQALARQKDSLLERRPEDPYRLLSELQAILRPPARIQSFVLERRFFQLEAVGPNPLALMDSFRAGEYFAEVRLLQTVPQPGSELEQFKITGSVRGE